MALSVPTGAGAAAITGVRWHPGVLLERKSGRLDELVADSVRLDSGASTSLTVC
jgi:hypothetical protein